MTPYHQDDWLTVWQGDCAEVMAQMPAESVHTVVTSPPYWGLRDYGTATWLGGEEGCDHVEGMARGDTNRETPGGRGGSFRGGEVQFRHECRKCGAVRQDSQLGLEPTPEEFVANMVAVFREVRRVLRADGTCWVNLGDSYAQSEIRHRNGPIGEERPRERGRQWLTKRSTVVADLKPKDLVGIPWRVAFALQADGWYLRSDVIWSKPNPMPESVTDRPTKAHEYLFLLSKSPRYYYDADAVREDVSGGTHSHGRKEARANQPKANAGGPLMGGKGNGSFQTAMGDLDPALGRNLRSVWTIATQPYPGAHFATFPEKLVEPCVKAGTSERGVCPECGAPWRRVVELGNVRSTGGSKTGARATNLATVSPKGQTPENAYNTGAFVEREHVTRGWQPSCAHDLPPVPAVVLDPFAGSGTTGRVAQRLGRRAVLIDLNADYLTQAMKRNSEIPLGLEAG